MKNIKNLIKNRCRRLYLVIMFIYYTSESLWIELKSVFRWLHIGNKNYRKIEALRNRYEGKRCFIIATGPSLRMEDLEALKDEVTFGMNSICMLYDRTDWRATYMGVQDLAVYEKVKLFLDKYCAGEVLISDFICKDKVKKREWILFPYNGRYRAYDERFRNKYWSKFSSDCHRIVYDGFTITYSLIQIACYMGFKEIYLLGADCNYQEGKKNHFIEHDVKLQSTNYIHVQDKLFSGYRKVKEYADARGIKVYNATRGGMLEIFPRVDFDSVLSQEG